MSVEHHRVVIVGGGAAGVTVAARLARAAPDDVALIEPSDRHYYQPLWTLVGGGVVPATASVRAEARVMPRRTRWVRDRAVEIDPDRREVTTAGGLHLGYDVLVVAAGIQLDWDAIPGLTEGIDRGAVTSNYRFDLAPRNWQRVHSFGGGTAVFAGVAGPHKCGGAIQKATYLAADEFRRRGVLNASDVVLATPAESIFGVPEFAEPLAKVVERYSIDTRFGHELVEVRPSEREAVFKTRDGPTTTLTYDLLHAVPPQSAPDFLQSGPRGLLGRAQRQDRRRRPQTGTNRGRQPASSAHRSGARGALRRVLVMSDRHRVRKGGPRRVRLLGSAPQDDPAHRHSPRTPQHVAPQAVRTPILVLAPHAARPGVNALLHRCRYVRPDHGFTRHSGASFCAAVLSTDRQFGAVRPKRATATRRASVSGMVFASVMHAWTCTVLTDGAIDYFRLVCTSEEGG